MYFWMHLDATIRQVAKYTNLHARGATMASLVWVARLPRFYCSCSLICLYLYTVEFCWPVEWLMVHYYVLVVFLVKQTQDPFLFESAITSNKKLLCNIRNWWAGQTPIFLQSNWYRIGITRQAVPSRYLGPAVVCIQVVESNSIQLDIKRWCSVRLLRNLIAFLDVLITFPQNSRQYSLLVCIGKIQNQKFPSRGGWPQMVFQKSGFWKPAFGFRKPTVNNGISTTVPSTGEFTGFLVAIISSSLQVCHSWSGSFVPDPSCFCSCPVAVPVAGPNIIIENIHCQPLDE